jgi:hypothetical protein
MSTCKQPHGLLAIRYAGCSQGREEFLYIADSFLKYFALNQHIGVGVLFFQKGMRLAAGCCDGPMQGPDGSRRLRSRAPESNS